MLLFFGFSSQHDTQIYNLIKQLWTKFMKQSNNNLAEQQYIRQQLI